MTARRHEHGESYAERLVRLQRAPWKRWLDVQRPYRMHVRRVAPGRVLDIGCGIGRNLEHLAGRGVGVDLDAEAVAHARALGFRAYTAEEFPSSEAATPGGYDTLLFAHVLEHVDESSAVAIVRSYLPFLAADGRIVVFTPQESGFSRDSTHVRFFDDSACATLAQDLALRIERSYSFPFPRVIGRVFPYNEFVWILRAAR